MAKKEFTRRSPGLGLKTFWVLLIILWATGGFASQESEILLARGNKYYLDGSYEQAKSELCQAASIEPANPEIRMLLGLAYFASQEYPQAEAELKEAIRLDPEVAQSRLYLGAALFHQGKYSQAERRLQEAQRLAPQDGLVRYYLSLTARRQNRPDEAMIHFNAASTLAPEYRGPFRLYEQDLTGPGRGIARKTFSLSFYTGMEYDDNFKILPDQVTLPYGGPYPGHKGSWRTPIVLEANFAPLRRENWEAGLNYFFYSGNNYTIDNFNFLDNRADIYLKYSIGPFTLQPWYGIDLAHKALERYSFFNNAGLNLTWEQNSFMSADLAYQFQDRSFRYPTAPVYDRSGYVNQIGLFQTFLFGRTAAWRIGGVYARELTEGVNWDNKSYGIITDASLNLPYRFNLWTLFEYSRYNFDNVDTFSNVRQNQNYYQISLQLRRPLTDYLDLIAGYTHVSQQSNIPDFAYDRNIYQLLVNMRY
ncbi:tetratricopeptide repeat protein [Desulfobacca acetoxidans]|nr:hypothetical protein [Desulfobacterales bacterium]